MPIQNNVLYDCPINGIAIDRRNFYEKNAIIILKSEILINILHIFAKC